MVELQRCGAVIEIQDGLDPLVPGDYPCIRPVGHDGAHRSRIDWRRSKIAADVTTGSTQ